MTNMATIKVLKTDISKVLTTGFRYNIFSCGYFKTLELIEAFGESREIITTS